MKTVAIIQARMGSTRLPGKVLMNLVGKSVLAHVVARTKASALVDEVVVATSALPGDDAIVAEAQRSGAFAFRGSEQDVLARYYGAAAERGADVVVRITSDCPLIDPELLTDMLTRFQALRTEGNPVDYLTNTLERRYPRGLDVEVFTFAALEKAYQEANDPAEREHVTPYFYRHPHLFRLYSYTGKEDLSRHRWTLDTDEDFQLISAIYERLQSSEGFISTDAVLALLEARPDLVALNAHIEQKKL